MPFTAEEFANRVRGVVTKAASRLPSYIGEGKPGYLTPPVQMNETVRARYQRLEAAFDREMMRQGVMQGGYDRNPEFIELSRIKDRDVRAKLHRDFGDLIGLDDALTNQGTGKLLDTNGRPYYFDRLNPAEPLDQIGVLYQQVTKQYIGDQLGTNQATRDMVRASGRIPRLSVADRLVAQISGDVPVPERFATFDIETTGLDPRRNKVWQVSIRGSDGLEKNVYFDFETLGTTKTGSLRDTILGGVSVSPAEDIKDILSTLDQYPALVGQNLSFDLSFLINNLPQNKELMKDPEIAQLLGRLEARAGTSAIWDTNQLARALLPDMGLAQELQDLSAARLARATPFSMENIILETNLLEIMQERHGVSPDEILDYLDGDMRGLHYADVDTFFEDHFAQELFRLLKGVDDPDGLRLAFKAGGFRMAGISQADNDLLRGRILQRHAITPYTAMGYDQVDDAVMEALASSRNADQYIKSVNLGRLGTFQGVAITPVEHEIIQSHLQNLSGSIADDLDYDQMLKGVRAHMSIVDPTIGIPTLADYAPFQQALADAGLPFASLSREERILSDALTGTLGHSTLVDKLLPRGIWHGPEAPTMVGNQVRRLVLPIDVLRQAEAAGVFDVGTHQVDPATRAADAARRTRLAEGEEMFHLSGFNFKYAGQREPMKDVSANFLFSYDEEQAAVEITRLKEFLRDNQHRLGIERSVVEELLNMESDDALRQFGVQVGTALERRGKRIVGDTTAAAALHDALARASDFVMVDNTDANTMSFGVRIMEDVDAAGRWTSGPVTAAKGSEVVYDQHYTAALESQRNLVRKSVGTRLDDNVMRQIAESTTPGAEKMPFKIKNAMDKATKYYREKPNNVRAAMLGSAALAGYYLYKRRESKNAIYEDTFAQQPYEQADFYDRYQAEMHVGMADQYNRTRSVNPMATAGLVQTLDRNKTRHTMMGSDKNNHLFGGSY